ncbi:MAG: glycosyltransferase family protein [Candidatus Rokubacteria bacterium]|nr:glycosyltransferase family protein [Candidatus Rokubacteria bacterium]
MTGARPRVVALVQARMGSSRLPGKVLAPLGGVPLLQAIVERVRGARTLHALVIATTERPADDAVAALAGRLGVACFRGADEDCLDRLARAARAHGADVVVRLTGDNPFVDGALVDWAVGERAAAEPPWDYVGTSRSGTFPVGISVEVVAHAALDCAWREATAPAHREHVTLWIVERPARFRVRDLVADPSDGDLRLTVDAPEDLELARRVFDHFGHRHFAWREAVAAVRVRPDWAALNRHVAQRVPDGRSR